MAENPEAGVPAPEESLPGYIDSEGMEDLSGNGLVDSNARLSSFEGQSLNTLEGLIASAQSLVDEYGNVKRDANGDIVTGSGGIEHIYDEVKMGYNDILGLPLYYNDLSDPGGRVFNETFMMDLPVVNLLPGEPKLNKKLMDVYGKPMGGANALTKLFVNEDSNSEGALKFGARRIGNSNDLRFIGFKPAFAQYKQYVQLMTSGVYHWLFNLGSGKDFIFRFSDNYVNNIENYGMNFFMDKSTSISEDVSNSYGSSKIADMVSEKSNTAREAEMFLGPDGWGNKIRRTAESIKAWSPKQMVESLFSYDSALTRTANSMFTVVNGSQLAFPEIWQDSKFDRSYSISFKFYSPYGDRESIFKNVYIPFIALLAFALPRQDGMAGLLSC